MGLVADQLLQQQQQQQQQQQPAPLVKSEAIPPEQNPNQHGKYTVVSVHEFMECDPPSFSGTDPDSDPTEFLEKSNKTCVALRCSPVRAVELLSFMLTDFADDWFASLMQRRKTEDPPLEWPEFSKAFLERFFPKSLQYARAREFEQLKQTSGMSVTEYDIQFTRLSRYAPHHVATEQLRVRRFVDGLQDNLSMYIPISETSSYCQVLDAALGLELGGKERQTRKEPYKKARFEGQTYRQIGGPGIDMGAVHYNKY